VSGEFSYPKDREASSAATVRALESLLIAKGVITDETVDKVLAYFESEMTPLNGKKIVVEAWTDPDFAARLVDDTPRRSPNWICQKVWRVRRGSICRPSRTRPVCTT
jgi:nitrile hydratase subunit alpha